MSTMCADLHAITRRGTLHTFPFEATTLPRNGIYVLFEAGETCHGGNRIVRVGTHTGHRQLKPRLNQHFVKENKDRSIFRKNIGRALLNRVTDPFLAEWNLDLTSREARLLHAGQLDSAKRMAIEADVTNYIQKAFSFVVFRVDDKDDRLDLESKMISTVSTCGECRSSGNWLGQNSTKDKIRQSGLWLVNELLQNSLDAF